MILKLGRYNPKKELEFEIKYLSSLSIKERFEMMLKKSKEMVKLLEKSGYRKPYDLITMKRASARPKDLEDIKYLRKLKRK